MSLLRWTQCTKRVTTFKIELLLRCRLQIQETPTTRRCGRGVEEVIENCNWKMMYERIRNITFSCFLPNVHIWLSSFLSYSRSSICYRCKFFILTLSQSNCCDHIFCSFISRNAIILSRLHTLYMISDDLDRQKNPLAHW